MTICLATGAEAAINWCLTSIGPPIFLALFWTVCLFYRVTDYTGYENVMDYLAGQKIAD
jgi:hypothetical protein